MVNRFSPCIKLAQSASFLENKNIGKFNLPVNIHISFKEKFRGTPGTIYINDPDWITPNLSNLTGIIATPYIRVKALMNDKGGFNMPTEPLLNGETFAALEIHELYKLNPQTKLYKVINPNRTITLHLASGLVSTVYLSPTYKIVDGLLHITKGPEVRNISESLSENMLQVAKVLMELLKLDTCAVTFETDGRGFSLVDVTTDFIPYKVRQIYEIIIPHIILTKAVLAKKLWLPRINLRKIEEQIREQA